MTPILHFQMASLCIAMSMIGIFRSELNIFMVLVLMHALAETALICGRNLSDYHGNDETGEKEAGERRRRTVKRAKRPPPRRKRKKRKRSLR